jgi:hypothetical protein
MQGMAVVLDWDELSNSIGLQGIVMWGELWVLSNRDVTFNVKVNVSGNMMNLRMGYFWISDRELFWQVYQSVNGLCR